MKIKVVTNWPVNNDCRHSQVPERANVHISVCHFDQSKLHPCLNISQGLFSSDFPPHLMATRAWKRDCLDSWAIRVKYCSVCCGCTVTWLLLLLHPLVVRAAPTQESMRGKWSMDPSDALTGPTSSFSLFQLFSFTALSSKTAAVRK